MNVAATPQQTKHFIFSACLIFCLWMVLVYEAFYSALVIWLGNDIFNHCLLVLPASFYLMWERRHEIHWSEAHSSSLAIFFFIGQLMLFLLGVAGDIAVFKHLAIFSMLPTLIWALLGNKIAWQLKFPLVFMLFAVPVGEELVPWLQEITADISVYFLQLSGIPLFRSGLFIEIPQGKFLVAEACSGISFLIASIVIGNLYAYMNLKSTARRVFFVVLSVLVPILANAVRVYGIIMVGYYTDMEHAVGADHLIYGWFFFAFVIIMLLAIGEWIRARERKALKASAQNSMTDEAIQEQTDAIRSSEPSQSPPPKQAEVFSPRLSKAVVVAMSIAIVISIAQSYRMSHLAPVSEAYGNFELDLEQSRTRANIEWSPAFKKVSAETRENYQYQTIDFEFYYAYFDGSDGELVSSLHRLYAQDRWTLKERSKLSVNDQDLLLDLVTSSDGSQRFIYYFYLVDGQFTTSKRNAKLIQVWQTLQGRMSQGAIIAVSFEQAGMSTQEQHLTVLEHVQSQAAKKLAN